MEKFYEVYFDLLKALNQQMQAALEGVSQEGIDWVPGADMNSMAVLVTHTSGGTRFLIGDFVGSLSSHRDREAEFKITNVDVPHLKQHLDQTMDVVKTVLEGLTLSDLERTRISPRDGKETTVAWCLIHALEHFAQHVGHIQITRQMWDQRMK